MLDQTLRQSSRGLAPRRLQEMIDMKRLAAIAVATTLSLLAASACGSSDSGGSGSGSADSPVTLTWWHNGAQDPAKGIWQGIADDYHKAHPNVNFKVEPTQNEALKTKISVALQSNNPPNIFQQWGGGALATQVQSGKLADITNMTS